MRGPNVRPPLQPRLPRPATQRFPREVGDPRHFAPRGPFSQPRPVPTTSPHTPPPNLIEVPPRGQWWKVGLEILASAATVETAVAAAFLGPMGIVGWEYLTNPDKRRPRIHRTCGEPEPQPKPFSKPTWTGIEFPVRRRILPLQPKLTDAERKMLQDYLRQKPFGTVITMAAQKDGVPPQKPTAPKVPLRSIPPSRTQGNYSSQYRNVQKKEAVDIKKAPFSSTVSSQATRSLPELKAVFQQLLAQWPRVEGKIDLSLVKRPMNLTLQVQFSDGKKVTIEALLRRYDKALGKMYVDAPVNVNSNDYLMWVLRQVSGDFALQSTSPMKEPVEDIVIDVRGLSDWKSPASLRRIVREVWANKKFHSEEIGNYWVVNRFGRRERLSSILSNYWNVLKKQFPLVPGNYKYSDALDVMHFQALGELRPHPQTNGTPKVAHALPLKKNEALPDSTTLEGAFKLAHLMTKTDALAKADAFPADSNREWVFYHPVTGQQVNYVSFMHRFNRLLANDKAAGDKRFETLQTGAPAVAERMPDEVTRRRLLRMVRTGEGRVPETTLVPMTQVRRVTGGQRTPQAWAPPLEPKGRDRIFDPKRP